MRLPAQLLYRKPGSHKGDFGHIFILSGSARLSGAGILCAAAAMRSGAGLVTLGIPKGINNAVIKVKPPEVMTLPLPQTIKSALSFSAYKEIKEFSKKTDFVVIGPGIGQEKSTFALVRKLIIGIDKPLVIDADGLNALAGLRITDYRSPITRILTPHAGEMARLTGLTVSEIENNRERIAQGFAEENHLILVLKGYRTVVADDKGNVHINKTGNPGMATAGSGDVLSGIIAAFLGQGLSPFNAAKYGVYLHGLAGDLAAKEKTQISLIASDIIDKIPEAIKRCN